MRKYLKFFWRWTCKHRCPSWNQINFHTLTKHFWTRLWNQFEKEISFRWRQGLKILFKEFSFAWKIISERHICIFCKSIRRRLLQRCRRGRKDRYCLELRIHSAKHVFETLNGRTRLLVLTSKRLILMSNGGTIKIWSKVSTL